MDIRITGPKEAPPSDLVNAWGARLRDCLDEHYSGRFKATWTEDKEAPTLRPPALRQWLTLQRGRTVHGRVSLAWDQERPDLLRLGTQADALPKPEIRIHGVLDVMDWLAGTAAFGSWVWFAVVDWRRVWNRVFTFTTGYDATHATHLEVVWFLLGWALSPAVAVLLVELLRARIEIMAEAWQRRRVRAFSRKDLDPTLAGLVQELLRESSQDPKLCLALGQAHKGQPHPTHPDLVWAENGQYQPAEGFRWASEEAGSLAVVPKGE